jgi:hypothetical protein
MSYDEQYWVSLNLNRTPVNQCTPPFVAWDVSIDLALQSSTCSLLQGLVDLTAYCNVHKGFLNGIHSLVLPFKQVRFDLDVSVAKMPSVLNRYSSFWTFLDESIRSWFDQKVNNFKSMGGQEQQACVVKRKPAGGAVYDMDASWIEFQKMLESLGPCTLTACIVMDWKTLIVISNT